MQNTSWAGKWYQILQAAKKPIEKIKSRESVPSEFAKIMTKYNVFIIDVLADLLPLIWKRDYLQ